MIKKSAFANAYAAYEYAIHRLLRQGKHCRLLDAKPINIREKNYTLRLLQVGDAPQTAPTLVFIAGVHGLEAIGVDILMNYLNSLVHQCSWSKTTRSLLSQVRLLALPMLNPSGIALHRRANGHGVDLMRNAPIDASQRATWLVGGHRYSRFLPWYRGRQDTLEPETQALFEWSNDIFCQGPYTLALDIHSGFGVRDQIWYPYAGKSQAFPGLQDVVALQGLFDESFPHHHHYVFSQQSEHYITHGDLWDWIYDHRRTQHSAPFFPLTLELGSWLWLKKNPRQLLNRIGLFHPVVAHRHARVLRQHFGLFDFLLKASEAWQTWVKRPSRHPIT